MPARRVDSNPRRADARPRAQPVGRPRAAATTQAKPYVLGCAAAGALSTCVSHTLTLPSDAQNADPSDAALAGLSSRRCRRIVAAGGPARALLAGFTANGCGYFTQGAIKFGLYEACKRRIFREPRPAAIDRRTTACRSVASSAS